MGLALKNMLYQIPNTGPSGIFKSFKSCEFNFKYILEKNQM